MDTIAVAPVGTYTGVPTITIEPELIQVLTVEQFIEKCLRFNDMHLGVLPNIQKGTDCPVHIYAGGIGQKACKSAVAGIKNCPVCGKGMCPKCGNHSVEQLSRVTGYIQSVGGWNESKKQELKDRQRYNIGVGDHTSSRPRK